MTLTEFVNAPPNSSPFFVLLGNPVDHSLSPLMHNTALKYHNSEARYYAIKLENRELLDVASFFNHDHFLGANVTIPYKKIIGNYLDHIDPQAREIGAVNTVVKDGYNLEGYNTDSAGFLAPLLNFKYVLEGGSTLVFGTGGAARAIVNALLEIGVEAIYLVSRNPNHVDEYEHYQQVQVISYNNWTSFAEESHLIVNATPLGMYPRIDRSPVRDGEQQYLEGKICYDIVYNPVETKFLKQAKIVGAQTIDGLEMLIEQGNKAFKLWTGKSFPVELIRDKLYERLGN